MTAYESLKAVEARLASIGVPVNAPDVKGVTRFITVQVSAGTASNRRLQGRLVDVTRQVDVRAVATTADEVIWLVEKIRERLNDWHTGDGLLDDVSYNGQPIQDVSVRPLLFEQVTTWEWRRKGKQID